MTHRMTRLTTADNRRKARRILAALALISASCLAVSLLLTGCAPIDLLEACAARAEGCQ